MQASGAHGSELMGELFTLSITCYKCADNAEHLTVLNAFPLLAVSACLEQPAGVEAVLAVWPADRPDLHPEPRPE